MAAPWEAYQQKKGPWEAYQAPAAKSGAMMPVPAPPEGMDMSKPKPGFMGTLADIVKSVPGAVTSGLTSFGALSESGRRGLMGIEDEAPAQTGPQAKKAIEGVTGTMPKAQTAPGKVVEAGVEAASNPVNLIGGAGLGRAAASAFGAGAGGEIAGQVSNQNPVARFVGGAVGGLAGGAKGAPAEKPAPSQSTILEAAEKAYDTVKDSSRKIPIEETSVLAEQLRNKLNEEGVYREAPEGVAVFKTIDRLTNALSADHVTAGEVHSITKTLQKISSSNPGNATGRAAQMARQHIFGWLKKFPELSEAIEVGNANYRAGKTSERLTMAKEKGELSARGTMTGDNIDPALRTQMRQIYFNKKINKTPEEAAILKSIVEGDTASNIAKKFALLKSPIRHIAAAVLHAKSAGILSHAAQMLAKSIANRNTARQVDRLDELVRRNSPAAGPRGPGIPDPKFAGKGAQRALQAARGGTIGASQTKPTLYEE